MKKLLITDDADCDSMYRSSTVAFGAMMTLLVRHVEALFSQYLMN